MSNPAVGNALSNREWAVVAWLAVFVFAMKDVRSGLSDILKTLVHPKIAVPT